ncbi:MAG TPA: DinB family protein [Acidimicrobiales bacterium]|nr:DinB family protein [Acidimicrobiales bacterium]
MSDAWVCPECGIDYGTLHPPFAINSIKSFTRRFKEALEPASPSEDNDATIRTRPADGVWSALEYTAHVADLMEPFARVLARMNDEDNPDLSDAFWDENEKAARDKYNEQDKDAVLARLAAGADTLVKQASGIDAHAWSRMGSFGWGERDMLTMLQNAVHEGVHHLRDVERGLTKVRAA